MSPNRLMQVAAASGTAIVLIIATSGAAIASHSPGCDLSSPHAKKFLATAQSTLPKLDKNGLERLGWQNAPKTVTLLSAAAKCDAVIAAHNAYVSHTPPAVRLNNMAAVVQANASYLVELTPENGAPENMIFVYDSSLKFRVVY